MSYFHELKDQAYQTFYNLKDLVGQAECYFLWGTLLQYHNHYNIRAGNATSPMAQNNFDMKRAVGDSLVSDKDTDFATLMRPYNEDENGPAEMFPDKRQPSALDCFEMSLQIYA